MRIFLFAIFSSFFLTQASFADDDSFERVEENLQKEEQATFAT